MILRAAFAGLAAVLVLAACATPRPPAPVPPPPPSPPAPSPEVVKAQRCEAVYAKLDALPDFQRQFTGQLSQLGEGAVPLFRAKFLEVCRERSAEEVSCLEERGEDCEALEPVLRAAGSRFAESMMASMTPEQRAELALKAARSEPVAVLTSIGTAARAHQAEAVDPAKYQFPPTVGPTPARDCCAQGGECKPDPEAWSGPSWKSLGIEASEPHRYQYEFKSQGKGKTAAFTARALGDPLCVGKREIWEISGKVTEAGVEVSAPRQVQ